MLGSIVEERYVVEAELGAGAMGHVYRARHVKVGRQVAIKVMHAELARVPSIVERFAREARVAARLDHPNLVSVLDVGVTPDAARLPLLVLELAPGCALADLMLGPMPRDMVVSIIRQLLRGLDYAHDAGLIHRDLKPDNILVEQTADGTLVPRIVDFGIAVYSGDDDPIAGQRITEVNTIIGTPFYMSPEQAMAKPLDARTDLFSLGVIMYELLAGMPPFPGSGLDVAYANASLDAPPIAERAGIDVDPLLESLMRKLMARRREDRFQSAHQALLMLELIETDRTAAARALSGEVPAPAPIAVCAVGSGPVPKASDVALQAVSERFERAESPAPHELRHPTHPVAVPLVRRTSQVTRVEHVAGVRPNRRRALWAGAIAAAALTAIVGWSAGIRPHASGPHVQASLAPTIETSAPSLTPPSPPPLRVEPLPAEPPAPPVLTPLHVEKVAVPARKSTPRAKPATEKVVVHAPTTATNIAAPPAPAPAKPTYGNTAKDVAARYIAVGRMLRDHSGGAEWTRYRMIRINEAIATEDSRRAAMATLEQIEKSLRAEPR